MAINTDSMIDVRDIIERIEELRDTLDSMRVEFEADEANAGVDFDNWARNQTELTGGEIDELAELGALLSDLQGRGGDEQWEGDRYPITLIRDDYFTNYAQELAEDCDLIKRDATWPNNCIDWEQAARELKYDYSSVEFRGVTYWTR